VTLIVTRPSPSPSRLAGDRQGSLGQEGQHPSRGRPDGKRHNTEHILHKKDGSIGQRNTYGNDPHPTKS
jgi:hypothetical protein